jgi:TolB-like protein/Flp pilus assembly protein TadD/predicted Ser/Thr protein kinase
MAENSERNDKTHTHTVLTEGTMVSHYKIVDKIGAGGMGEVFLADDTKLKRTVALKFLPVHLIPNKDAKARFTREAQAAAGLKHPNIVTIHEVSDYQGRPFFAMECCDGKPLREVIKEEKLSLEKIIGLVTQICEGLQEAHEAGIVHRDIKPSNIILDKKGRPKLVDFGLAAVQGTDKLTKTGSTLGTVGYMSPEQIRVKETDQRSDLFSIGVVLYKMITGRQPFAGETEAATLNSVLNDIPEPLSRYKSGVSGELQRIVSKLLEKDPELRYQTAAGLVSDLKRLSVGDEPIEKPRKDWWNRYVVTGAVAILGIMFGYWILADKDTGQSGTADGERVSLAVLPFENLGNPDDAYFADGMTDEITARLASIHGLRVTSRTSAMQYRDTDKSIKEIGKELGVDFILEGTIRWDKSGESDRVRIIPQLIQVSDDSHIWANTFEREITQVFAVQADIATQISEALGVALLEPERQNIATEPTQNMEAYHFYLRGKLIWADHFSAAPAIKMFEKAVEYDTSYFQAYAMLARLYGFIYINNIDRSEQCYNRAKQAAERALRYAKGHSDGYLAMGYFHYYFSRNYDRALEQFEKAKTGQPNNSELMEAIGYVQRRQGRWEEALANLQRAFRIDPMNLGIASGLTRTLFYMRRFEEAKELIDLGFESGSEHPGLYLWNMWLTSIIIGDTVSLRTGLNEFEQHAEGSLLDFWGEIVDIILRDYESAISRRSVPGSFQSADSSEFYINRGFCYALLGEVETSLAYYDSARTVCEKRVQLHPDNATSHSELAQAYAGIGRYDEAIKEAKTAVELLPISKDALSGSDIYSTLAEVYSMAGEYEAALDVLDSLLKIPSMVHVIMLRYHPIYDPLRENPRFQTMLEEYAREHGHNLSE